MSDTSKYDSRDFSAYDTMETEELRKILRTDIESENQEQNTEQLFYIMNLLAEREEKCAVSRKTPEEAYAEFREFYDNSDEDVTDAENVDNGAEPKPKKKVLRLPCITKTLSRVAVIAIAVLVLSATLVMSVDALRRPTMKLINTHFPNHSLLSFVNQSFGYYPHDDPEEAIKDAPIPEGFRLEYENIDDVIVSAYYTDAASNYIKIQIICATSVVKYNSEGYECSSIAINDHEALFLVKGEDRKIIWLDEDNKVYYMLASRNLDIDELMKIADYWAMQNITFSETQ